MAKLLREKLPLVIDGEPFELSFCWGNISAYTTETGLTLWEGFQKDLDNPENHIPLLVAASGGKLTGESLRKNVIPLMASANILREIGGAAIWGPDGPPPLDVEEGEKAPEGE